MAPDNLGVPGTVGITVHALNFGTAAGGIGIGIKTFI